MLWDIAPNPPSMAKHQQRGSRLALCPAEGRKSAQYFEVMGSRGIYKDGWFASVLGPRGLAEKNKSETQGFRTLKGHPCSKIS